MEDRLEKITRFIQEAAEERLTREGMILPGETIIVRVEIVPARPPIMVHVGRKRRRGAETVEGEISEDEWQKLLSLPVNGIYLAILKKLHEAGGKPLRRGDLGRYGRLAALNAVLCRNGLQYRIRNAGPSATLYPDQLLRLVHVR